MHHAVDLILQDRLAGAYVIFGRNGAMVRVAGVSFSTTNSQKVGDVAVPGSATFKETMNEEAGHTMNKIKEVSAHSIDPRNVIAVVIFHQV
jgi:hypothetical protein